VKEGAGEQPVAFFRTEKKAPPKYSPKRLGLGAPRAGPVEEYYISGKHSAALLADIFRIFLKNRMDPFSCDGYFDESSQLFSLTLCLDLSRARCTSDQLLLEIRKLPSVAYAERRQMHGKMFESFMFPLTVGRMYSAVALPVDAFSPISKELGQNKSLDPHAAIFVAGRKYGVALVSRIANVIARGEKKKDPSQLLENVRACFKATGWGIIDFRFEENVVEVLVRDMPDSLFSDLSLENSPDRSPYLYGFIAGLVEGIGGNEMVVKDSAAGKLGGILKLYLTPRRLEVEKKLESEKGTAQLQQEIIFRVSKKLAEEERKAARAPELVVVTASDNEMSPSSSSTSGEKVENEPERTSVEIKTPQELAGETKVAETTSEPGQQMEKPPRLPDKLEVTPLSADYVIRAPPDPDSVPVAGVPAPSLSGQIAEKAVPLVVQEELAPDAEEPATPEKASLKPTKKARGRRRKKAVEEEELLKNRDNEGKAAADVGENEQVPPTPSDRSSEEIASEALSDLSNAISESSGSAQDEIVSEDLLVDETLDEDEAAF
jgi:hypothetical protein